MKVKLHRILKKRAIKLKYISKPTKSTNWLWWRRCWSRWSHLVMTITSFLERRIGYFQQITFAEEVQEFTCKFASCVWGPEFLLLRPETGATYFTLEQTLKLLHWNIYWYIRSYRLQIMISSTSKKPAEFAWPSFYELPPFFTYVHLYFAHFPLSDPVLRLQPVEATRKKQTQIWCELILNFCRHHNIFELDVNDSKTPLFYNEKIKSNTLLLQNHTILVTNFPPALQENYRQSRLVTSSMSLWIKALQNGLIQHRKTEHSLCTESQTNGLRSLGSGSLRMDLWIQFSLSMNWVKGKIHREKVKNQSIMQSWIDSEFELFLEFSGLDQRIILKALRILEQQGKAKVIANEKKATFFFTI